MDQPHILVTGDAWQYVPFGRARLKSLRATGLSYASQSYTVDGTTIKVRIVGDQSFIQIDGEQTLYCESGQLFWPFRPRYSPLWGEAATWAFMDIPTTGKYLGRVKTSKEGRGGQVNSPKLSNGMRSKAIGWPLADLGNAPANEAKDKETQEKYSTYTITKKRALSTFPASLFSGKMRLFMQALYGAKEPNPDKPGDYFPFALDDMDAPTVLSLRSSLEGGAMLIARSDSMGIFTAPDDTYWLLDINEGPRNVLVNKINTTRARALVEQLKDMGADERTKAEAFIFANSTIEIPKPENTVYATGTFPGVVGAPMAYGWKWSESGSKASIVVHEQLGETIIETRWHARTVHLTFSYTAAQGDTPARINVSGTVEDHNDWIDGWGQYNIFTPGLPPVLDLHSLRAGSGLIPPVIAFPMTPIYGWYAGETWEPMKMQNRGDVEAEVNSSAAGVVYPYGASCPPHSLTPWVGGVVDGVTSHSFHIEEISHDIGYLVSFKGLTIDGRMENRKVSDFSYARGGSGPIVPNNWPIFWVHTSEGPYPLSSTPRALGGVPYAMSIDWNTPVGATKQTVVKTTSKVTRFVVVIPRGDAEAAYLARSVRETGTEVEGSGSAENFTSISHIRYAKAVGEDNHVEFFPLGDYFLTNASGCSSYLSLPWIGFADGPGSQTSIDVGAVDVLCFNRKLRGTLGVPGGSYGGLFDCSYLYPQYDRGMYTYTSYGGRYIMSEAPSNPTSITWHNFVGWA